MKTKSVINYVKKNFLKNFRVSNCDKLVCVLNVWNEEICNKRVHGITKEVHELVFSESEKNALMELPVKRYQIIDISTRKVSRLAHLSCCYNYYPVEAIYIGPLSKIYSKRSRIALHSIS